MEVCSKQTRQALENSNQTFFLTERKGLCKCKSSIDPVKALKNIKLDCVFSNVKLNCDICGKVRRDTASQHCPREGIACYRALFVFHFGRFHDLAFLLLTFP